MEKLKKIVDDIYEGRNIYERVPLEVRPCWGAFLLERFSDAIPTVSPISELIQTISNPQNWGDVRDVFNKIRAYGLEYSEYHPESYLALAEKIAKITYNTTLLPAPFDANSGWFIPRLALQTAFVLEKNTPNITSIIASVLFMFERQPVLRKQIQSPNEFRIYRLIDDILWKDWCPIGLNDILPRDEYQSYAAEIFQLLKSGVDHVVLANHLFEIETVTMGLSDKNMDQSTIAAKKIIACRNYLGQ